MLIVIVFTCMQVVKLLQPKARTTEGTQKQLLWALDNGYSTYFEVYIKCMTDSCDSISSSY